MFGQSNGFLGLKTGTMTTEYHDDNTEENSFFRTKESLFSQSTVSRFRQWLIPGLTAILILIIIITLGATNTSTRGRLWFLENSVSNVTDVLTVSHRMNKESAKDLRRLKFAVERHNEELNSVGEALNHLSALESLSHTIASIKCNLDRIMNNGSQDLGCCPLDWVSFESSCYFFSKSMLSWDKARDWCNTRDSHLVILHEDKDWKFVTAHTSGLFHWIGLTDERTGQWEWVNQTPYVMNRIRWKPGQPDEWTGHGQFPGGEDCAHLHHDGRLNDLHCPTPLATFAKDTAYAANEAPPPPVSSCQWTSVTHRSEM
ncbi:LOW QUALITY PROTEIN: asialoglycoprotein receptor 1 [Nelusetta ayraudi]|uniref:LOW QUALITY PROTEIN: asialoglycoprotein receptor 1 n=1 Tax=Nelusetta ayraudi TaxID=303726 RepID=UPI003F70AD80